jgi:curli biogenesis system outer membrane secretion channel CsgG
VSTVLAAPGAMHRRGRCVLRWAAVCAAGAIVLLTRFVAASVPQGDSRPLVAVAGFENRSAYAADKLWDTSAELLTAQLVRSRRFRVVEWRRMKDHFDWDTLSTSDLVKVPENRGKAREILLCEYFVAGAVTRFDVTTQAKVSAFSKSKIITTTIRVDLALVDARTGEHVAQGAGEHAHTQTVKAGFSGGQTGTWDPSAASVALERAIALALGKLIQDLPGDRRAP